MINDQSNFGYFVSLTLLHTILSNTSTALSKKASRTQFETFISTTSMIDSLELADISYKLGSQDLTLSIN